MSSDLKAKIEETTIRCSFCSKTQNQVRRMISGPDSVFICDECVILSLQIISEGSFSLHAAYFGFEAIAKLLYPLGLWFDRKRKSN
jgi:hypothetical protein